MLKLLGTVLRTPRLWPVVALIGLAGTGIVTHVTDVDVPVAEPVAAAELADAGAVTSGAAGSGPSAAIGVASGGANPKSQPMQLPTGGAGTPAGQAPPASPGGYLPSSVAVDDAAVHALIVANFPAAQVANASRIATCESGQRSVSSPPNSNGSRDHGIFQLNDGGTLQELLTGLGYAPTDVGRALDPEFNVRAAALLYSQRGWQPWTCAAKLGIVAGLWSSAPGPNAGG